MITDVEHLFMCLLAICVPSLEKYLLKLTPSFYQLVCFSGCLFVWAICLSLYASVFSRLVCCLFILSMAPFAVQKLSGLIWSHVFAFDFVSFALGDRSKIIHFMSKSILPCFLLGFLWFLVLYLDLWSFLRVVCVCVCVCLHMLLEHILTSFFCIQLTSFPSTTSWRDCIFLTIYSCLICYRLISMH